MNKKSDKILICQNPPNLPFSIVVYMLLRAVCLIEVLQKYLPKDQARHIDKAEKKMLDLELCF